jgi:hypothetical protein
MPLLGVWASSHLQRVFYALHGKPAGGVACNLLLDCSLAELNSASHNYDSDVSQRLALAGNVSQIMKTIIDVGSQQRRS